MNKLRELLAVSDSRTQQQLRQVYPLITTLQVNDDELLEFATEFLPKFYTLVAEGHVRRDALLLSALGNLQAAILRKFVDYEAAQPLNIRDGMSLFSHCYYNNKHWFEDVLNSATLTKEFDEELQREINELKVIKYTNQKVIDIDKVRDLLAIVKEHNNEDSEDNRTFITHYTNEIEYIVKVFTYCKEHAHDAIDDTHLFRDICNYKLLHVFDKYLRLNERVNWQDVIGMLQMEETRSDFNSQSDTLDSDQFRCFVILTDIILALQQAKGISNQNGCNVGANIIHAREILYELDAKMQIFVLEDIFALCFLRWRHFQPFVGNPNGTDDEYFCDDQEIRIILHFLKPCLDDLNAKIPIRSVEAGRLQELNKYVAEALWRLEMLDDMERFDMGHMLADAETLIRRSFRTGRFDKVHQVIQLFNMEETDMAAAMLYTEKMHELGSSLQQAFRMQELQRQMPNLQQTLPYQNPKRLLKDFIEKNGADEQQFEDIAFMAAVSNENSTATLECITFAPELYEKFQALREAIPHASLLDALTDPHYPTEPHVYKIRTQYFTDVRNTIDLFNAQIKGYAINPEGQNEVVLVHRSFANLKQLAGLKDVGQLSYFHRVFNYLKMFLRAFSTEGNNGDVIAREPNGFISFFDIMKRTRADWIGKLVGERSVDPRDLEHLFSRLKLDLLYCTAANSFPDVCLWNYKYTFKTIAEPTRVAFSYIAKRNWLLAFIINEIFNMMLMDVNETRTKYFMQYVNTQEIDSLRILYNDNRIVAALNQDYYDLCVDYLNKNIFETEMFYTYGVEEAEEVSEDDLRGNWMELLMLIDSIPELHETPETCRLRDRILSNLVADIFEDEGFLYVRYVKDPVLRRQLIIENFSSWPGEFNIHLLRNEQDEELLEWAERIQFCENIRELFDFVSWFPVHELCMENPSSVYHKLLSLPKANLLLEFRKFYQADQFLLQLPVEYFTSLFEEKEPLSNIKELLDLLENPIDTCLELVQIVRNLNQLDFLINCLIEKKYDNENYIKNVNISAKMLRCFPAQDFDHLWCLISNPLAIIEMLIMNMKLDKLATILNEVRSDLSNCEFNDTIISLEGIDELLRSYAEKSLEFRVILDPHPSLLKGSDVKLMESLDSIYGPDRKCYQMPEKTPTKAEWTPNNEVVECMCCHNTTFSMFNRRHHCRRCGRVICFNCSTKRMRVPSYGDILVRVCIDCYNQSQIDERSDTMSTKSIMYDHWFLSDNNEHNAIVRQEFSYEHAPSVSLCLSIMKLHTKTQSYPKFLLDQCDALLKLLQPTAPSAPQEVDYMLVIKMLRSLAIAAKMLSAECQLQWGSSQADRILSQADLFSLLAERGCLNLLPPSSNGAPYVDAIVLRKLRDKLLMQEQWNFALDVSTKAGLENAGVFAAWGKSCLKAGCLQMAREKFQRCLDKSGHYDNLSNEDDALETSTRSRYSRLSLGSETKPTKNPPVLEQIIEILENQTVKVSNIAPSREKKEKEKENAILIKAKLRNLKAIANGHLEPRNVSKEPRSNNMDPVYFQECLYYLKKYGSHSGILEFYLKHNCIKQALIYMYDNKVSVEIFIEVYTICLRDGQVSQLQKCMSRIDSTLEIWKEYLRAICRHLEKQGLLNSLYQLQQFMVDYVRAAMTCIRFYKDQASSYAELATRMHYLHKAESHLLQELEQQQWIEVNAVVNTASSDSSYEEKAALSNPSLVMKMGSRTIDQHIRTIKRQVQITNFLSKYPNSNVQFVQKLPLMTPNIEGENTSAIQRQLPTLFDSQHEKAQLAVLLIICGQNVEDGYDLAYQLIQDYKLKPIKVYCQAGRQLAREDRYVEIAELVNCIRSKGTSVPAVNSMCDEMLTLAVRTLSRNDIPVAEFEPLIKLITDRATKISIYIETKQLKSAYLLAAKYNRFGDIRRILREAELINKQDIKKLCQKLLQVHSHSKD